MPPGLATRRHLHGAQPDTSSERRSPLTRLSANAVGIAASFDDHGVSGDGVASIDSSINSDPIL